MISKLAFSLVASATLLSAGPTGTGQTFADREGNTLRITSPFSEPPGDGMFPVIVEITSMKKAARWSVIQGENVFGATYRRNMVFECPAGETRRAVVLLASSESGRSYMDGVNLEIIAPGIRDIVRYELQNRGGLLEGVLVGENAVRELGNRISGSGPVTFLTGIAPLDWRAYAGYAGIVVTDKEWRAMDPGARVAIGQYVKGGGRLLVLVPDETAATTLPAFPKPDDPKLGNQAGLGRAGFALTEQQNAASIIKALAWNGSTDPSEKEMLSQSLRNWRNNAPEFFPRRSSVFTGFLMLIVLVAFAILIGPVNLFVFAPAKRRHRLFFSVPVIALSTSLLLLVFVLLSDGIGGKGHRYLLIENRPGEGEAVNHIIQYQTSRCGVLFSTGFESKASAIIRDLGDAGTGFNQGTSGEARELVAEPDNLTGSGPWFVSRTNQNYRVAALVPGRGRVEVRGQGAGAQLTSTFAYPLEAIWFRDAEGKWWKSGPLKLGEPTGVTAVEGAPDGEFAARLRSAPEEISRRVGEAAKRQTCFVAFTGKPEGVATHSSIRWIDRAVVTGPLVFP